MIPENPRAFPSSYHSGMRLRDFFVAQVIAGLITSGYSTNPDELALQAGAIADAMLRERPQ